MTWTICGVVGSCPTLSVPTTVNVVVKRLAATTTGLPLTFVGNVGTRSSVCELPIQSASHEKGRYHESLASQSSMESYLCGPCVSRWDTDLLRGRGFDPVGRGHFSGATVYHADGIYAGVVEPSAGVEVAVEAQGACQESLLAFAGEVLEKFDQTSVLVVTNGVTLEVRRD